MSTIEQSWPGAFHWWIDAVGAYRTFTKSRVVIGHAGDKSNDLAIMGDLSARHAELCRGREGFFLVSRGETAVNNCPGKEFLLHHGDHIRLRGVELVFQQPIAWCLTARLELLRPHRFPLALDGVVLLGETCVLGPKPDAHIRTPWKASLFVNWYQDRYWVRGAGEFRVDGQVYQRCAPLHPEAQVECPWGAFRWEPGD
jgi:hypothetical protein